MVHNLSLFLTKNVEYFCGIKKKNQEKQEIIHKKV